MTPLEIAMHRTGGLCACGCGRKADRVRHVFHPLQFPKLQDKRDNLFAYSSVHGSKTLPRRVARHAERLARTTLMADYLTVAFLVDRRHEVRLQGRYTTFKSPWTSRWVRVCSHCHLPRDLGRTFYICRRKLKGNLTDYDSVCKKCRIKSIQKIAAARVATPEGRAEQQAEWARHRKAWRKRHPERSRAQIRRYRERLRKDPVRHAASLEIARINYRLKAEREGRGAIRAIASVRGADDLPRVPVQPLLAVLSDIADDGEDSWTDLSESIGVSDRSMRRWKTGEVTDVSFDTADRILTALGLLWFDVWNEADFPEVHARLAA